MESEYPEIISKDLLEMIEDVEDPIGYNRRVAVYSSPSWKHGQEPYFKVFVFHKGINAESEVLSKARMYRISMLSPKYIYASDNGEKDFLSKEELSLVLDIIYKSKKWELIIFNMNIYCNTSDFGPIDKIPEDLPIPNYNLLPTSEYIEEKYASLVSIELKEVSTEFEKICSILHNETCKLSMQIFTSPSWKVNQSPYFKVFISYTANSEIVNNYDFIIEKDTKMYRISMTSPEYVVTEDNGEKGYMSKQEIENMIHILIDRKSVIWNYIVSSTVESGSVNIPLDLAMPDYTKLPTRD